MSDSAGKENSFAELSESFRDHWQNARCIVAGIVSEMFPPSGSLPVKLSNSNDSFRLITKTCHYREKGHPTNSPFIVGGKTALVDPLRETFTYRKNYPHVLVTEKKFLDSLNLSSDNKSKLETEMQKAYERRKAVQKNKDRDIGNSVAVIQNLDEGKARLVIYGSLFQMPLSVDLRNPNDRLPASTGFLSFDFDNEFAIEKFISTIKSGEVSSEDKTHNRSVLIAAMKAVGFSDSHMEVAEKDLYPQQEFQVVDLRKKTS